MRKLPLAALAGLLMTAGCYHATVNTGLQGPQATPQSTKSYWMHSWIYGLVPAKEINAAEKCGGGQASKVETELSFANQLVELLTLGIYTPLTVIISCTGAKASGN